jgi:CRISPR-associated protein Cmr3
MTWLFIEPEDVWLFRDGRPFAAGEGHGARSLFPPSPHTLQGALRALILHHSGVSEADYKARNAAASGMMAQIGGPAGEGQPATLGAFSMAGPFLARMEEGDGGRVIRRYTPLPADVWEVAYRDGVVEYIAPAPTATWLCHSDLGASHAAWRPLLPPDDDQIMKVGSPEGMWVDEPGLRIYLSGKNGFGCLCDKSLYRTESRLGIGIDYDRKRPRDSMLYTVDYIRTEPQVGLLVKVGDGVALPAAQGWMALGGETRAARYRVVPGEGIDKVDADDSYSVKNGRLKLVLLTPAYFNGGWQPQDGKWEALFGGHPVDLVSAAIGRPYMIGGWDLATRWHKPMYSFVPAGSVYYFQSRTEHFIPVPRAFTQQPPGELPLGALGFGQVAAGAWDWRA